MDGKPELLAPRARQDGLVVRELEDEVLVYDLERNQAHCLNQTAGLVWKHCDGETTISDITELLRKDLGPAANDQTVWHALVELGKDHLLEEQVSRPATTSVVTRRHMLQKVGVAVTAAAVTSIAVGGVAQAAVSCTGCGQNQFCCSGVCCNQTCCGPSQLCCGQNACCNGACCGAGQCCATTVCCSNTCCQGVCCAAGQTCKGGACH